MKKQVKEFKIIGKDILICSLILIILGIGYFAYSQNQSALYQKSKITPFEKEIQKFNTQIKEKNEDITSLQNQIKLKDSKISSQKSKISSLEYDIEQKKKEIQTLKSKISKLEEELGITKTQLEEAKPYQERVSRGQNLYDSYSLLGDYEDYAKPIILNYLGLSQPIAPINDGELWERGKQIYNWISKNYKYCGDKGLRVGKTFYEFQFYSPDELLMSDNARCGDCDDFATLFAGLMYASGVPENKVLVACGDVPAGAHCWNWILLDGVTYRVDGVCSQKNTLFSFLGFDFGFKAADYTSTKKNVTCFNSYEEWMVMNPSSYRAIKD